LPSESSSLPKIFFVLPPREVFSETSAGAISLIVHRLAAATQGATVLGRPPSSSRGGEAAAAIHLFPNIPYLPIKTTLSLIATIRRENPTSIDIHQQPRLAIILSLIFPRAKILLLLHNDPLTMRGLKTPFARRLALSRLHRVICVSNYLRTRYMTGLTEPGPSILPNPITLKNLPPPAEIRIKNILFAGRIVHDKAPDIFIAACVIALPQLPGWTATICGGDRFGPASPETPYVAKIRAAAAQAGIAFSGPIPHAQILTAMSQAAIAVVPSRWPEPFGLTALEALACGAALITTGQGGLPEVAGEAPVYVPPDDPAALAAAILALARDPATRATLAAAGLAQARQFDTQIIAAALENLRHTV
jgi:UDP-glucose:(glucosyl)LPS alpha-1,2-glucosyltransferase